MQSPFLEKFFLTLPALADYHAPEGTLSDLLKITARQEVERLFSARRKRSVLLKPFGGVIFPYHPMGNVDSRNLFDFDELIMFSFYWLNRHRYHRVADLGANIGLHSLLLDRCGFRVRAYEPDPKHFAILKRNLQLNRCSQVKPFNYAISNRSGKAEFIRVLGNTTGNHLAGAKASPYGTLERISVEIKPIQPILRWADLLKIDVEGHEKEILLATNRSDWLQADALVEIGNEANARSIFRHFQKHRVNLFAQKINWQPVRKKTQMPTGYKDGSLFVSCKRRMPWHEE